mmetsp:Transcript_6214/g.11057  ORF Transcript_6214/g.11057 Transcript_6214/m.11057 type:complete len:90 (+) Transcript_6214:293-562(+)
MATATTLDLGQDHYRSDIDSVSSQEKNHNLTSSILVIIFLRSFFSTPAVESSKGGNKNTASLSLSRFMLEHVKYVNTKRLYAKFAKGSL